VVRNASENEGKGGNDVNTLIAIYDERFDPAPAKALVKLTMKDKRELYLCNDYVDVKDAIGSGDPFEAHVIVGMQPRQIVINPTHVATAEAIA
jgi:hypothetical protein